MPERYFIHRHNSRLYADCDVGRFRSEPDLFHELTRDQYIEAQALQQHWRRAINALAGRHDGETAHVFGNGPSLKFFASRANWKGKLTIGINAAGESVKPLRYWISVDNLLAPEKRSLHDWVKKWLATVTPRPIMCARMTAPWIAASLQHEVNDRATMPDFLFGHSPDSPAERLDQGLYWTKSSVHAGIDLARHMGCKRIMLWGVDYNDRSHSYTGGKEIVNDKKDNPGQAWTDYEGHVRGFEALKAACLARGIEVLNANPQSKLDTFRRIEPEEAFQEVHPTTTAPELGQAVLWFTFYTPGTDYEKIATKCVRSFGGFGLHVVAVPYANSGDWMRNAMLRSQLLASMAAMYPEKSIGLMDCDLECLKPPAKLYRCPVDFAGECRPSAPDYDCWPASVLMFGATEHGRAVLARWAALCKQDAQPNTKLREQLYLCQAVRESESAGARIDKLPRRYNRRPEECKPADDTVILHTPASRKMLAVIGGVR